MNDEMSGEKEQRYESDLLSDVVIIDMIIILILIICW